MIVEGINCASELIKANYPIEKVIINKESGEKFTDLIDSCTKNKIKYEIVDKKGLEKITKSGHSQGVVCFVRPYEYCYVEDILDVWV